MAAVGSGTLLDERYRLVDARASGATATVWVADDEFLRRRVAVKLLHPHLAEDQDLLARFEDEARTAATVSHPNLVAVYDSIRDRPGIVLEWIDGPDLRRHLDDGRLSPADTIGLGTDICSGLHALHVEGLVHRDVKPANILLTPSGDPKLTDFGIATANAGDRTATGIVLGTAKYLAPEQVQGGEVDGRTDVFALAAVLYEALAGEPPWIRDGDLPTAIARLEEDAPDLGRRRPGVPADLVSAIMRGLARRPEDRWPSAAAFASALLGGSGLPAPPPPPARPATGDQHGENEAPTLVAATPEPTQRVRTVPSPPEPRRPLRPRRRLWPRVVGFGLLTAIGLLGLVLVSGAGSGDDPEAPVAGSPLRIERATAFDPEGTGTPGEHDDRAAAAIDGDSTTSWPTERYASRTFGTKSGVGLILELDAVRSVEQITIETLGSRDWSVEVRIGTIADLGAVDGIDDFGPAVAVGTGLPRVASISTDALGNVVVLWITDLGDESPPLRLNVAEVTIR